MYSDEILDFARPILHKTIYIGGLGVQKPKPLDEVSEPVNWSANILDLNLEILGDNVERKEGSRHYLSRICRSIRLAL